MISTVDGELIEKYLMLLVGLSMKHRSQLLVELQTTCAPLGCSLPLQYDNRGSWIKPTFAQLLSHSRNAVKVFLLVGKSIINEGKTQSNLSTTGRPHPIDSSVFQNCGHLPMSAEKWYQSVSATWQVNPSWKNKPAVNLNNGQSPHTPIIWMYRF